MARRRRRPVEPGQLDVGVLLAAVVVGLSLWVLLALIARAVWSIG